MISNMDKERNIGLMVLNMKEPINSERKTAMANSSGPINLLIVVHSLTIIFTDMESTDGLITESTQETGSITKCMEQVYSLGPMEENMKETTTMIRNKDMVFSHGRMDVNMMVSG